MYADLGAASRRFPDLVARVLPGFLLEDSFVSVAYNLVRSGVCCTILSRFYVNESDPIVCFSLKPRSYLIMAIVHRERAYLSQVEQYLISLIYDYYNSGDRW